MFAHAETAREFDDELLAVTGLVLVMVEMLVNEPPALPIGLDFDLVGLSLSDGEDCLEGDNIDKSDCYSPASGHIQKRKRAPAPVGGAE